MQNRVKNLEAILSLCVTLLLVYFLFWKKEGLVIAVFTLIIFTLLFKVLSGRLAAVWLKITHAIGTFYTTIILAVLFFLILTPVAVVFRLFNPKNKPEKTNLDERNHTFGPADFDQIF